MCSSTLSVLSLLLQAHLLECGVGATETRLKLGGLKEIFSLHALSCYLRPNDDKGVECDNQTGGVCTKDSSFVINTVTLFLNGKVLICTFFLESRI